MLEKGIWKGCVKMKKRNFSIDDSIFDFVYDMAFNDSTLRNAFPRGKLSETDFHKRKNTIKDDCKQCVKAYIDAISDSKTPCLNDYIDQIKESCISNHFTFGNAQKLFNMTAKYMYISCYDKDEFRGKFINCDCPMDSIMINHIYSIVKEKEFKDEYLPYDGAKGVSAWCDISWSKIKWEVRDGKEGKIVYDRFQKIIEELAKTNNCSPLEYDYYVWRNNK